MRLGGRRAGRDGPGEERPGHRWVKRQHLGCAGGTENGIKDDQLIRAAGLRWPVEEDLEFGKDNFGLDQSQVRLYHAIARPAVLVMAALAICAVAAALLKPGPAARHRHLSGPASHRPPTPG